MEEIKTALSEKDDEEEADQGKPKKPLNRIVQRYIAPLTKTWYMYIYSVISLCLDTRTCTQDTIKSLNKYQKVPS